MKYNWRNNARPMLQADFYRLQLQERRQKLYYVIQFIKHYLLYTIIKNI